MTIMRRVIIPTALAFALGCTSNGDRAAVSDTSAATIGAQPESPAATKPAAKTPAGLTVNERGIGRVKAGMSAAEASAAVDGGLAFTPGADTAGCGYAIWHSAPPGVRLMVESGLIARVEVDSASIATAAGAKVGDTEERVRGLYGGRATVRPLKYEDGHYLTVLDASDTTFALVFETVGGRVKRYRAGHRPQVEYVEGCS